MNKEQIKLEELPENVRVIDVPDDVYVSSTGKCYYPEATTKARIKIPLERAEVKGYKPSKEYKQFIEKLAKEQK